MEAAEGGVPMGVLSTEGERPDDEEVSGGVGGVRDDASLNEPKGDAGRFKARWISQESEGGSGYNVDGSQRT